MQRRAVRTVGLKWIWNGTVAGGWALGMLAADASSPASVLGQTTDHVFGTNIHRYYEGDYSQLIADVSEIVNDDLEDPRIYYLRGLAFLKTGQEPAAAEDLRKGAELEAIQFGKRNYNIARTMQRIQGNDRAMLEAARSDAMKRRSELRSAKAGIPRAQILAEMGRSILDPPPVTTARPNLPDPTTLTDKTAPFGDGWDNTPQPRPTRPTQPATKPSNNDSNVDPFGEAESTPTPTPTPSPAADPFGTPAENQATPPAAEDDPFGQPEKTVDPFSTGASPTPNSDSNNPPVNMTNVNGRKVLGKLFGALASPIRRAAEQGANAVQNIPGVGQSPNNDPPTNFPGAPSSDFDAPADPFGNR